jgi:hypothetical protein
MFYSISGWYSIWFPSVISLIFWSGWSGRNEQRGNASIGQRIMKVSAWGEQMIEHLIEHLFWGFAGRMNGSRMVVKTRNKRPIWVPVEAQDGGNRIFPGP